MWWRDGDDRDGQREFGRRSVARRAATNRVSGFARGRFALIAHRLFNAGGRRRDGRLAPQAWRAQSSVQNTLDDSSERPARLLCRQRLQHGTQGVDRSERRCKTRPAPKANNTLHLTSGKRTYVLEAKTADDCNKWQAALTEAIATSEVVPSMLAVPDSPASSVGTPSVGGTPAAPSPLSATRRGSACAPGDYWPQSSR